MGLSYQQAGEIIESLSYDIEQLVTEHQGDQSSSGNQNIFASSIRTLKSEATFRLFQESLPGNSYDDNVLLAQELIEEIADEMFQPAALNEAEALLSSAEEVITSEDFIMGAITAGIAVPITIGIQASIGVVTGFSPLIINAALMTEKIVSTASNLYADYTKETGEFDEEEDIEHIGLKANIEGALEKSGGLLQTTVDYAEYIIDFADKIDKQIDMLYAKSIL